MKIGTVEINGNLVLAPMAGYTDAAFRSLCWEQGCSLAYTEMISAKALYYKNKNTKPLLQLAENEGPVALQLFGNDPELLAQEAEKLQDEPYAMFDVNMACPVPKVVNNGEGSALMLEPDKVGKIVGTMVKRLKKPVSVKIRKGFNDENINAVEIAKIAQDNGASLIAVHGRTREEMYHGKADYDIIRKVREAVQIPVLGSGDIYTREDALRMLDETGADGVMVARGARGNPWIFRQIQDRGCEKPDPEEVKNMIMRQLELMIYYLLKLQPGQHQYEQCECAYPEDVFKRVSEAAVRQMRKHVGFYSMGYPDAARLRREINTSTTLEEFTEILTLWRP